MSDLLFKNPEKKKKDPMRERLGAILETVTFKACSIELRVGERVSYTPGIAAQPLLDSQQQD